MTGAGGNEPGPGDTVVLRADLAGEPDVLELLKRTDEATESTRSHRDVPFDAIVDAVDRRRAEPDHHPLVQVAGGLRSGGTDPLAGSGTGG